jgi:hypothetical protein
MKTLKFKYVVLCRVDVFDRWSETVRSNGAGGRTKTLRAGMDVAKKLRDPDVPSIEYRAFPISACRKWGHLGLLELKNDKTTKTRYAVDFETV